MKEQILKIINRRLTKIDASTYSDLNEIVKAGGAYEALTQLRDEIIALREPYPPHACQDCGSTNFRATLGGENVNSMTCVGCGKVRSAMTKVR